MKNKDRAINILHYKKPDRMVAVHFGYWIELLKEWEIQGNIPKGISKLWTDGNEVDRELDKIIGWDFNWYHTVGANNGLFPKFPYKQIEVSKDGFITYQNGCGLIEKKREGAGSIPSEVDYLLKDRKAFEELYKTKMDFCKERIDYEYFSSLKEDKSDIPIGLHLGSVLGTIRNILSVVGLSYMICDDYDLLGEIIDTYADMQYKCIEEILKTGAKFDFAHYWEDICFKNGPLLSPTMFQELCAKHYKKRNDLVKSYGIDIISLDCDGVTDKLLPIWYSNGVNTMFPIEVGTWGDQFEKAREKYGKGMLGVGAMDKTAFRKDKQAVDDEIKRISKLVKLGGFIPCPDHRIMPGSKFELVKYYAEKIKDIETF